MFVSLNTSKRMKKKLILIEDYTPNQKKTNKGKRNSRDLLIPQNKQRFQQIEFN